MKKDKTAVRENRTEDRDRWTIEAINSRNFHSYQLAIMHDWLRTLTLLASILIPLFFVLDIFMMPSSLLPKFAIYRGASMLITIIQRMVVLKTKPGRLSYIHGYLLSFQVGGMISLMTTDLGGFSSSYYAGLNLVIIGVNLLMPWREIHTFFNTLLIIVMYLLLNLATGSRIMPSVMLNNLFFLGATSVLSIGINFVRFRLINKEFLLLVDLGKAKDDLQGEKEIVEDRTISLKSLLDVSGQGFLSFDKDFKISAEYSRECLNIFGKNIEGVPIDELIFNDPKSREDFRTGIGLFFSGKAKAEVIFDHLDRTFSFNNRTIRVAYKAVHSSKIMMILTDITGEIRREEESRRENEKWEMLRKVIANRQAFGSFDREAKMLFSAMVNASKSYEALLPEIHTLKGNAGFLGFRKTQESAHVFEDYLANHIALGEEINPKENIERLMNSFAEEMLAVTSSLGTAWRLDIDLIELPKSEYLHIEDHIRTNCPDEPIISSMEEHRRKPLAELTARYPKIAEQIAQRLGKRIAPMSVIGDSIAVVPEVFEELLDSFTHIIRNMVDHGIEPPAERESKGKPPAGTVGIEIEKEFNDIVFNFSDDGRGIQFPEIENRARKLGYLAEGESVSTNELLSFIFRDNFSTTSQVSDISGRGVGLAAVRIAVKKMGGQIKVKTWKDRGTIFTIRVPANG